MAFWGACVTSTEPYVLKLDGDHKRLRISQAVLEPQKNGYLKKDRSILQCAVGSTSPVSVCSLSKDFCFSQLDLEFEESEQVIFTVKGPQVIHLSGYYVRQAVSKMTASTSTNDLTIECLGEEIVISEKGEERKLAAGMGDSGSTHGFLSDKDLLVNTDMHDDADEKMAKEKLELLYAFDSVPEREDEDYVLCIRKSATSGKLIMVKEGEDADKVIVQRNTILKGIDSIQEETTDDVSGLHEQEREASLTNCMPLAYNKVVLEKPAEPEKMSIEGFSEGDASHCNIFNTRTENIGEAHKQALDWEIGGSPPKPSMLLQPSCELDLQNSEKQEKERVEVGGKTTVVGDTDYKKSGVRENEVQQTQKESDDVCQGCDGNQLGQKSSTNTEAGGSIHLPSIIGLPSCESNWQNRENKEKERKEGSEEEKTIEANIGNCKNAVKEVIIKQAQTDNNNNMCQGCARNQRDPISVTNIEIGVLYPLVPPAEVHDAVDQRLKEQLKDGNVKVQPNTADDGKPTTNSAITFFTGKNSCSNGSSPPPSEVRCENRQKSKKRKKKQVLEQKYVTGGGENIDHASKKETPNNNVADMEKMVNLLPAKFEEHKPADDKNHDGYPEAEEDGCQFDKEHVQEKKQKIKAKENGNHFCATSSKARTLSNGLIIEDLTKGKSRGKVAGPGKKIKIFYTARLRETGVIVESNVGHEKPFKFCLGDERIIEGWNLGIKGMRIGGRRRLIIPPSLGYSKSALDVIPPNSWLVFDIDLVYVC